jgi:signal transduction histidine kinase
VVAAVVSGFYDATVIALWRGESYWWVWRTRLFSNTLTALALVPVLVSLLRSPSPRRWGHPSRRGVEAALLFLLLIAVGAFIFTRHFARSGVHLARSEPSDLVLLLPLLLWAAARFGAAGSSFAILTTAVLAFVFATAGRASPTAVEAAQAVRGLQAFLLVSGIPLFGLGALMDERRSIEQALEERLRFEEFLSRISAAFVHLPSDAMDAAFETQLRHVGEFAGIGCVQLFRSRAGERRLELVSSWSAPGPANAPRPSGWSPSDVLEHAARHDDFRIDDPGDGWSRGIALEAGDRLLGALVFVGPPADPRRHDEPAFRLHLIAEVFASALARKESEEALRVGEEMTRRSRDELAHFLRVSTVGELTTSLAHELNQPLAAILANAQAAQMMLAKGGDLGELPDILSEIVEEDKRAGEVIRRLRELLRKGEPVHVPLDLNVLAREVVRLISGDATLRDVSIRLDLAPERLSVIGDRIQIQQVMLNLLLNAMDAMGTCPAGGRQMVVSTAVTADRAVRFGVSDTGEGLREGGADRIFEPFYTTKPAGMGMGLSIARSIVVAHGGRIWARDNPGSGATLQFTLPLAPSWPA